MQAHPRVVTEIPRLQHSRRACRWDSCICHQQLSLGIGSRFLHPIPKCLAEMYLFPVREFEKLAQAGADLALGFLTRELPLCKTHALHHRQEEFALVVELPDRADLGAVGVVVGDQIDNSHSLDFLNLLQCIV